MRGRAGAIRTELNSIAPVEGQDAGPAKSTTRLKNHRHTLEPSVRQSRATYPKGMALDNQLIHSHPMRLSSPFHKSLSVRASACTRTRLRGFTAIELMVVVAILAILAAIAAPSFTPLIERWRVMQTVDGLQSTLYFARSEAVKRGGNIVIRKEPSGANGCPLATSNTDWDCGWYVFVDTNGNGTLNTGEEILQRFAPPANITVTRTGGGANIQLSRWGTIEGTYLGFNIVPLDKSISDLAARGLCMSSAGRIRTVKGADIPCTN